MLNDPLFVQQLRWNHLVLQPLPSQPPFEKFEKDREQLFVPLPCPLLRDGDVLDSSRFEFPSCHTHMQYIHDEGTFRESARHHITEHTESCFLDSIAFSYL